MNAESMISHLEDEITFLREKILELKAQNEKIEKDNAKLIEILNRKNFVVTEHANYYNLFGYGTKERDF